ncbi:MAG: PAS domain S-box protein [Methanolinea sp.]
MTGAIESIRDITERKRAESALAESEKRFRDLSDLLPLTVFEMDRHCVLSYANRAAFEMFGYTRGDFEGGLSALQMIAPEDRERARVAIDAILSGKRKPPLPPGDYTGLRKDGSRFPITVYSSPIVSGDTIVGIRGIITDNTSRKAYEDALRARENLYRTIFETAGTAMVLIEADGTISLANSGFARLSGYSREEIENRKKWMEFVVPEDLDRMVAQHRLRRTDPEKALKSYEFRFVTRTGEIRDIHLTVDIIPGTDRSVASLLDFTERKRAESALREATAEYTHLLESVQDVYVRVDLGGRLVKASRSFATLLGYDDLSECIGKPVAETFYFHPPDRERFLEEVLREGRVTDYEIVLKRKDGSPVIVSTNSHLWYGPDGTLRGVEGIFRDVTERKAFEKALAESEARYRDVVETQTELISRFTPDGTHVFANDAYCRYFGLPREGIIGRRFRPNIPPEDRKRLAEFFSSLTPENPAGTIVHRVVLPDGRVRWHRWTDRAFFDGEGRAVEYQSVGQDITDLVEAEERLRLSFEATRDGYWDWDIPTGNAFFSPQYHRMLGYEPGSLPGHYATWRSLVHPDDIARTEGEIWRALMAGEEGFSVEFRMRRKDGDWAWILARGMVVGRDEEGRPLRMVGTHVDITDRKVIEEALREANRKITLLSGITRHDIANQLTAIRGYAAIGAGSTADPDAGALFRKIDEASEKIARFLEFMKVYQEIGVHAPTWQSIREVVRGLDPGPLTVTCDCDAEVLADPMLGRVFGNIVENASRHGGKATRVSVSCEEREDGLLVVVADDGVGIPAGEKERIFEKGYGNHTGFGLFLAREILALTGIAIRETGTPGEGARFELLVPRGKYRRVFMSRGNRKME